MKLSSFQDINDNLFSRDEGTRLMEQRLVGLTLKRQANLDLTTYFMGRPTQEEVKERTEAIFGVKRKKRKKVPTRQKMAYLSKPVLSPR